MHEGDKNTKYFHTKAFDKKKKKSKTKLQIDYGEWKKGAQFEELIIDYFQQLFSTSIQHGNLEFLSSLKGRVTCQRNEDLNRSFIAEEIQNALVQMHPLKALGPDSIPSVFFNNIGISLKNH